MFSIYPEKSGHNTSEKREQISREKPSSEKPEYIDSKKPGHLNPQKPGYVNPEKSEHLNPEKPGHINPEKAELLPLTKEPLKSLKPLEGSLSKDLKTSDVVRVHAGPKLASV